MYQEMLEKLRDPWLLVGFIGQVIFFSRFVVQWIASEKARKSVVPNVFWYLSIGGSLLLLIYSIHIADPIFILAFSLNIIIYLRNIILIRKQECIVE